MTGSDDGVDWREGGWEIGEICVGTEVGEA